VLGAALLDRARRLVESRRRREHCRMLLEVVCIHMRSYRHRPPRVDIIPDSWPVEESGRLCAETSAK